MYPLLVILDGAFLRSLEITNLRDFFCFSLSFQTVIKSYEFSDLFVLSILENMFGGECLNIFKLQILIACYTNSIPFEWDKKTNRIRHVHSRKRLLVWWTYVILTLNYTRFVLIRLLQTSPHVNIHVRLLHVGWLVAYIASSQIQFLSMLRRNEIILLINGLIEFEDANVRGNVWLIIML